SGRGPHLDPAPASGDRPDERGRSAAPGAVPSWCCVHSERRSPSSSDPGRPPTIADHSSKEEHPRDSRSFRRRMAMAFIGFDVYGTLVDPLGMDRPLREHVGELAERFAATWRERQIDWTFRRALMGRYVDFDVVTRDAFRITCATLG